LLNKHLISTGLEYTQNVCAIPLSHAVSDIPAGTNETEMRNLATTPRFSQLSDVNKQAMIFGTVFVEIVSNTASESVRK
jgi:hypothetical protein